METAEQKYVSVVDMESSSQQLNPVCITGEWMPVPDQQSENNAMTDELRNCPCAAVHTPPHQLFMQQDNTKQEKSDDSGDTKRNITPLPVKPFPVALYMVDNIAGIYSLSGKIRSSEDGSLEVQCDAPSTAVGLMDIGDADYLDLSTTDHLKTHERTRASQKAAKMHKCSLCPFSGRSKSSLDNHMGTHTGEKPYKCSFCPYTCCRKASVKSHEKSHTWEKSQKCFFCGYTCGTVNGLKAHVTIHTHETPHACKFCSYRCAEISQLLVHERNHEITHTGEKTVQAVKCQLCPYSCSYKSLLDTHMITSHTHQCSLCPYACSSRSDLKIHARTHKEGKSS